MNDPAQFNNSGSLCPASKAASIIGDKWTLLILREFFLGSQRFNEIQNALPRLSPTILSKRLKKLEADGLIIRKSGPHNKSVSYNLTKCGRELGPLLEMMSKWGLRWARRRIEMEDVDIGGFMWDVHRTLNVDELPDGEVVIAVQFKSKSVSGVSATTGGNFNNWWLIVHAPQDLPGFDGMKRIKRDVDLCTEDPGRDVDVYLTGDFQIFVEVWMGDLSMRTAIDEGSVMVTGTSHLSKTVNQWFAVSRFANIRPERLLD